MFDHMADLTEPICQKIDPKLAAMTIFDTSGIEAWTTKNNPKYSNRIIRQLKALKKAYGLEDSYDPYKAAYSSMPTHAASNPAIQQMYVNGHFCYAYKFGIITNGLGIIRDISFFNKEYLASHPDIIVEKKSNSRMKINPLQIPKPCFLCLQIIFRSTRLSTQKPFCL